MPKTTQTADTELGIEQTRDLAAQEAQIESLQKRIRALQEEANQRIRNIELNLRGLKQKRDEEINQLRDDYDRALNKGAAKAAGDILKKIKACHEGLIAVARQMKGADGDIDDLKLLNDEIRMDILKLIQITERNLESAKSMDLCVRGLLSDLSTVGRDFDRNEKVHSDGLKLAEEILSD